MWWKLKRAEFTKNKGPGNRRAMKKIVDSCETPGLIAFAGKRPVAWCAVAPREAFPVLDRSRILRRVDDAAVWSIVCFFVAKPYRQRGLQVELIKAAVKYAAKMGARIVEGYPMEPRKGLMPDAFAWTGLASAFRQAKFVDVARRSKTRPIMRFVIE